MSSFSSMSVVRIRLLSSKLLVFRGFNFRVTHTCHLGFQWRAHPLGFLLSITSCCKREIFMRSSKIVFLCIFVIIWRFIYLGSMSFHVIYFSLGIEEKVFNQHQTLLLFYSNKLKLGHTLCWSVPSTTSLQIDCLPCFIM
jgi:hypothetical protein